MPMPSPRLQTTASRPSSRTVTRLSVKTPSKSKTSASSLLGQQSTVIGLRAGSKQDLGDLNVDRIIDLPAAFGGHLVQSCLAEKSVLGMAETGDLHDINGTGFQVLRLAVLPKQTNPLVVVNTEAITRLVAVPQKIMEGDDGQGRISALKFQRLDHTVDIFRRRSRAMYIAER